MSHYANLVTLFTDASWLPKENIGSWGYWAKHNGRSVSGGGRFKTPVYSSNEAEWKAVANALDYLSRTGFAINNHAILIQLDNMHVVRQNAKGAREIAAREHIRQLKEKHSWRLIYRHVKGHQLNLDARSYINNLCDTIARNHR